jgi:electron transport complex protein RnfC
VHRGLPLVAHKHRPIARQIDDAPVPATLALSIKADGPIEKLVLVDDRVLLGQLIARSGGHRLHSPVSGRVSGVEESPDKIAVTIASDGRDVKHASVQPTDYLQLSPEALCERIEEAGIVGLGGACFPTARKLLVARTHATRLLIVNGVECEPFIACDDALMQGHAADVVFGTQILLHASEASQACIAIESDKPEAAQAILQALGAANDQRIHVRLIECIYPAGGERQLVQTIAQREVPTGGVPADVDVLCQNVGTAAAIAHLIRTGEPLFERVVTITGSGVKEPRNLRARFGTAVSHLIEYCGGYADRTTRLIMGGTMMGVAQSSDEVAVGANTNCLIVANEHDVVKRPQEMPCIRCGDCAEVCPAGLLPQQLLRFSRNNDWAALRELGLRDCIECGCCDYVCPSQIRLTATFDAAKRSL